MADANYIQIGTRVELYDPGQDKIVVGKICKIRGTTAIVSVPSGPYPEIPFAALDMGSRRSYGLFAEWDFRENCLYDDSPAW